MKERGQLVKKGTPTFLVKHLNGITMGLLLFTTCYCIWMTYETTAHSLDESIFVVIVIMIFSIILVIPVWKRYNPRVLIFPELYEHGINFQSHRSFLLAAGKKPSFLATIRSKDRFLFFSDIVDIRRSWRQHTGILYTKQGNVLDFSTGMLGKSLTVQDVIKMWEKVTGEKASG